MSEFNRQDLFSDDLLSAPMILSKGMDNVAVSIDKVRQIAMSMEKSLQGATSLQKIKTDTQGLTTAEVELDKISKQLAASEAKKNEIYIAQVKALQSSNKEVKDKIALGERDAKTITAQNASYKVLDAALQKNKNSYKELTNEEQRNSAAGKELLKIIQAQDAQVKALGKTMGESQKNVGNYKEAFEGLDGVMNGSISNAKALGKQLLLLAANPVVLTLTALVGVFKLLSEAENVFYTSTLRGEEAAKRSGTQWEAFFEIFKDGINETGEEVAKNKNSISEFFANLGLRILGGVYGSALIKEKERIVDIINSINADLAKLFKEHIKDIVDDAQTELKVNKLLEDSKDKLRHTDEERLKAVREAGKALKDQLEGDIRLADADIKAQERIVELRKGKLATEQVIDEVTGQTITKNKLLSDYTKQEFYDLKLTGEEIKKLADLQVARINLESKAAAQRKALLRQEVALVQEIEKARIDAIRRRQDADTKLQESKDAKELQNEKDLLKNEELTLQERLSIVQSVGDKELKMIQDQKDQELTIVKRAAEDRNKEEAQIKAFGELEKNPELTGKELIAIQDKILGQLLSGDKAYQEERQAVNNKFDDLEKIEKQKTADELLKIQIDATKKAAHAEYLQAKEGLDATVQLIKQRAIDGKISKQKADEEILDAQKSLSDDYIKLQIDELRKVLMIDGLGRDEKIKIEEQLYKLKVDLQNAYFEQLKGKYDDEIAFLEKLQKYYQMFSVGLSGIFNDITEAKIAQLDKEEQRNNAKLERELKAAGDNAQAKADIQAAFDKRNEQLEKKKIDQQRKAAIFDKALSATQAAIGVSLAVIKAGVVTPLAIATAIAGAIQIAAILAKPIPSYFKGTLGKPHKGGAAIVGEKGFELFKEPGKPFALTPNNASIMDLAPGTEVLDHEKTIKMLAMEGLRTTDTRPRANESSFRELGKKLDLLNHTIKHKKELHINYSRQGAEAVIKSAEARLKFMRDFYD